MDTSIPMGMPALSGKSNPRLGTKSTMADTSVTDSDRGDDFDDINDLVDATRCEARRRLESPPVFQRGEQKAREVEYGVTSFGSPKSEVSESTMEDSESNMEGSRSRSQTWDSFEDGAPISLSDPPVSQDVSSPMSAANPPVCVWFAAAPSVLLVTGQRFDMSFAQQGSWVSFPCALPASTVKATAASCAMPPTHMTTLMLRNIPNNYDPDDVLELLDLNGFAGQYDFFYLPRDLKSRSSLGYAFVNFVSSTYALRAFRVFDKFCCWKGKSRKACEVQWSRNQGLDDNVSAALSKPALRKNIPESFKPAVFRNGVRVEFPEKTGTARTVRSKNSLSRLARSV